MKKLTKRKHHQLLREIFNKPWFIPVIFFVFFSSLYFSSTAGILNSGDAPQYALTQALVDKRTIQIDDYSQWIYPDYALYKGNKYSLRTFGESLVMTPFYLLGKIFLTFSNPPYLGMNISGINSSSNLESLTVLSAVFSGTGLIILSFLLSFKITENISASVLTSLTMGIGTLFWRYSSQIQRFSHSSFLFLLSFYLSFKFLFHEEKPSNKLMSLIGLTLGFTLFIDLSFLFITIAFLIFFIFLYIKRKYHPKGLLFLFLSLIIPLIFSGLYNFIAFGNPLTSSYLYNGPKPYFRDMKIYYSTPIIPSIFINLFSNSPIAPNVLSPRIGKDFNIDTEETSYLWATKYNYKGIFTQTPALYLGIIGLLLLFRKNKFQSLVVMVIPFIFIVQTSKLIFFFGANSYDSHYFLPAIPFLILGLGYWISRIVNIKMRVFKIFLLFITSITIFISIYNGWYSNITNFAPHITGEHRFSFDQLIQPWYFSWEIIRSNARLLFINTFPNIYNLHLLFTFYFFPVLLIYLIYKLFVYLVYADKK